MVEERYRLHTLKLKLSDHPKYIIPKLKKLERIHFGYNAFGLKDNIKRSPKDYIKNYLNYKFL